jgi:ketosteroid isomerase-like protein
MSLASDAILAAMERDDNVAVVRQMWDAYRDEGLKGIVRFAAPDAEWRPYSARGRVFHNTAAYADYIAQMERNQEVVEAQLSDVHALGDLVVVSGRLRLRGPDGLEDVPMHWVHRFREGRIVLTASYPNLDQALEAAGLDASHRVDAR